MDIFVECTFSGAHHLRGYPGNCGRHHGHNWKVKATVRSIELDELGMGIDFRELRAKLKAVLDDLDHSDLNAHPAFQNKNPSSEHLATFIFHKLQPQLFDERYTLHAVEVRETDSAGVIYYGDL